ncbi:hypothetical protein SCHPADRAFT_994816 [Schizopora paradoxa]|uniref:Uncharacterized protein n=1 Tax=Schizopora paradoxa TaxID=27342 RepID=A0A0H2RYZ7_9AGAM|nr:hypothetical protein SCHPADRAFT_994816 [Schizopora paradoxa]
MLKVTQAFGGQFLSLASRRSIHYSASVLAKGRSKSRVNVEGDKAEDYGDGGDLFSSRVGSSKSSRKAEVSKAQNLEETSTASKTSADLFNEQYTFVWDRLGPAPTYNSPQIRANALRRILRYSEKEPALLDKFVELTGKWRASGRAVDRETTLEFIDRCVVRHPTLLVRVFSDHTKYGMDIPDVKEARRILRAIVLQGKSRVNAEEALQSAVSFAALYPLYGFRPASTDLTSCTLLAQACSQVLLHQPSAETNASAEGESSSEQKPNSSPLISIVPDLLRTLRSSATRPPKEPELEGGASQNPDALHAAARESGRTQSHILERMWVAAGLREIYRGLEKIGYSKNTAQGPRSCLDIIKEELDARTVPAHS